MYSDYKIKVFISSKMGMRRYDDARNELFTLVDSNKLLENMSLRANMPMPVNSMELALELVEKSHICIFLLGEAYGVTENVYKEYLHAKKNSITCLFCFCKEGDEKPYAVDDFEIKNLKAIKEENQNTTIYIENNGFADFANHAYNGILFTIAKGYLAHYRNERQENLSTNQTRESGFAGGFYADK